MFYIKEFSDNLTGLLMVFFFFLFFFPSLLFFFHFQKQVGIAPRMFKSVIAASHPEFSTMRQQVHSYFMSKLIIFS